MNKLRQLLGEALTLQAQTRPLRFVIAGLVNSVFGFLVYSLTIQLFAQVWLGLVAGICAGITFNFFTTGGYVFRDKSRQRIPRFVASYTLIFTLNYALLSLLMPMLSGPIVAQAVLTPFIALFSYFLLARFVFGTEPQSGRLASSKQS